MMKYEIVKEVLKEFDNESLTLNNLDSLRDFIDEKLKPPEVDPLEKKLLDFEAQTPGMIIKSRCNIFREIFKDELSAKERAIEYNKGHFDALTALNEEFSEWEQEASINIEKLRTILEERQDVISINI